MSLLLESLNPPATETFTPESYLSDGDHSTYLSSVSSRTSPASGQFLFPLRITETFATAVNLTEAFYDISGLFPQIDGVFGTPMTYPWTVSMQITTTVADGTGSHATVTSATYPDFSVTVPLVYSSVTQVVSEIVVSAIRVVGTPPLQNETTNPNGTYVRIRGYALTTNTEGGGSGSDPCGCESATPRTPCTSQSGTSRTPCTSQSGSARALCTNDTGTRREC